MLRQAAVVLMAIVLLAVLEYLHHAVGVSGLRAVWFWAAVGLTWAYTVCSSPIPAGGGQSAVVGQSRRGPHRLPGD